MMIFRSALAFLGLTSFVAAEISFNQDIRPILSAKCIMRHGPDDGVDAKGKPEPGTGVCHR